MDYQQALAYLDGLGKFGIRLGMERMETLLRALGNPERRLKTLHVTGTNGKGSVASMLANILLAAGLKTGKFTSPHLVKYNERIMVNGAEISDAAFAGVISRVRTVADALVDKGACEQPTQFEILTAAAFLHFYQCGLEYAVIEVGLGGLWDSTNVITPVVSVITNVALDHTDRCGSTIAAIAMQKAGIIKDGVPLVTAAAGEEALGVIVTTAVLKGAPVYLYGRAFRGTERSSSLDGQVFTLFAGDNYRSDYHLQLAGAHQITNASVAIVAARLAAKQDARISEAALHAGVAATVWPGRLERVSTNPDVLLDGAHNPAGAAALRNALDKYYPDKPVHFVLGMMQDKDIAGILQILLRPCDSVRTVRPGNAGSRPATAQALAELAGNGAVAMDSLADAYAAAVAAAAAGEPVCICGSLYLVGEFKALVQGRA